MVRQPSAVRGVLLFHHVPPTSAAVSHLDLMIEATGDGAGRLWCWSWEGWPAAGQSLPIVAKALHRAEYLSYQGEVSGGRGSVHRLDAGVVRWGHRSRSGWCCQLDFDQLTAQLQLPCPELDTDHPVDRSPEQPANCWRVVQWSASAELLERWNRLRRR
jgi:hypothetical protein